MLGQYAQTAGELAFGTRLKEVIASAKAITGGFLGTDWTTVGNTRNMIAKLIPDAKVLLPVEKQPAVLNELNVLYDAIGQWRKGGLSQKDIATRIVSRLNVIQGILIIQPVKEVIKETVVVMKEPIKEAEETADIQAGRTPIIPEAKSKAIWYILGAGALAIGAMLFLKKRK
jgi:hypothetical protein